jgi:GNAT superfamily N-acetyltransferase
MDYTIRSMTIEDHDAALRLWQNTEWIHLSETDARGPMALFLNRNPGLSLVVHDGDELIGTILCCHDGRRGHLHHLAIDKRYRRQGIGSDLVQRCLTALAKEGIIKCNIYGEKPENVQPLGGWQPPCGGGEWQSGGFGGGSPRASKARTGFFPLEALAQSAGELHFIEENAAGMAFWARNGFELLPHFGWMQKSI